MLSSANLIGKPRAVINETVEINNKSYVGIVNVHTITVSAYVIEFTNSGLVEEDDEGTIIKPAAKETDLVIEEKREAEITGKWKSKNDNFQITIDGSVGFFSQINSGKWLRLLQKGKVNIYTPIVTDITKESERNWRCLILSTDGISVDWEISSLTLDATGNNLTVTNSWEVYTLTKVKEEK